MKMHGSQEVCAVPQPADPLVLSLSKHEREVVDPLVLREPQDEREALP
jgi:hypothetical protein